MSEKKCDFSLKCTMQKVVYHSNNHNSVMNIDKRTCCVWRELNSQCCLGTVCSIQCLVPTFLSLLINH